MAKNRNLLPEQAAVCATVHVTDSATVPYFEGRLQIISGWKGSAEEYIFSLRKLTEEK